MKKNYSIFKYLLTIVLICFMSCSMESSFESNKNEVSDVIVHARNNNALVEWTSPKNKDVKGYELCVSPCLASFNEPIILDKTINKYFIEGLDENIEYTFTVRAIYDNENYSQGIKVKGRAVEDIVPDPYDYNITSFSASVVNDHVDLNFSLVNSSQVLISAEPNDGNLKHPLIAHCDKNQTIPIYGLKKDVQYKLTIQAISSSMKLSKEAITTVTIPSQKPIPEDVAFYAVIPADNSAKVYWKFPSESNLNTIKITYSKINKTRTVSKLEPNTIIIKNKTEFDFTNLENDVEYSIKIQTINDEGTGSQGIIKKVTPRDSSSSKPMIDFILTGQQSDFMENQYDYDSLLFMNNLSESGTIYYSIYYPDNGSSIPNFQKYEKSIDLHDIYFNKRIYSFTIYAFISNEDKEDSPIFTKHFSAYFYPVFFEESEYGTFPHNQINVRYRDSIYMPHNSFTPYPNKQLKSFYLQTQEGKINRDELYIYGKTIISPVFEFIPPSPVNSLELKQGNRKITLSWINPIDEDISQIIIKGDNDIGTVVLPKEKSSYTFKNLLEDITYNFEVYVKDKREELSTPSTISGKPYIHNIGTQQDIKSSKNNLETSVEKTNRSCVFISKKNQERLSKVTTSEPLQKSLLSKDNNVSSLLISY